MSEKMQNLIIEIYQKLYELYGPQGWWPLINYDGVNPIKPVQLEDIIQKIMICPKKEMIFMK